MRNKSEKRTLLTSVIMSAPGPLILLVALMFGQSSTQIADFVRRSAELLALVIAFVTYLFTCKTEDILQKAKYEKRSNLFTGIMMCFSGIIMLVIAIVSDSQAKGTVIPSLAIAFLGVVANTLFWIKYTKLNHKEPNSMMAVQARLYRAKTFVDACVVCALISVWAFPATPFSYYLDKIGSSIVSLYLCACGVMTINECMRKKKEKE